jgi:hypothetical protein
MPPALERFQGWLLAAETLPAMESSRVSSMQPRAP